MKLKDKGSYIYDSLHNEQFIQVCISDKLAKQMFSELSLFNKEYRLICKDEHGRAIYLYRHDFNHRLITVNRSLQWNAPKHTR